MDMQALRHSFLHIGWVASPQLMQSFMQYAPHDSSAAFATDANTNIIIIMHINCITSIFFLRSISLSLLQTSHWLTFMFGSLLQHMQGMKRTIYGCLVQNACNPMASFSREVGLAFGWRGRVLGLRSGNRCDSWGDNHVW